MDSESLAQVERIVTTVTEALRQDMAALRQSTETTAVELRRDMNALRQSTETTTVELRRDMNALRQSTETTAVELRQDMNALHQSTEMTAEDIKRHTGVLIEGLRHDVQSVAEGFQMHLDRRHAEDHEYMDREFRELRALLKLSYAQLHDRVEALDHRVSRIEQRLGLSE